MKKNKSFVLYTDYSVDNENNLKMVDYLIKYKEALLKPQIYEHDPSIMNKGFCYIISK